MSRPTSSGTLFKTLIRKSRPTSISTSLSAKFQNQMLWEIPGWILSSWISSWSHTFFCNPIPSEPWTIGPGLNAALAYPTLNRWSRTLQCGNQPCRAHGFLSLQQVLPQESCFQLQSYAQGLQIPRSPSILQLLWIHGQNPICKLLVSCNWWRQLGLSTWARWKAGRQARAQSVPEWASILNI